MKKCPKCNKTYNDSWEVCLTCRTELEDIGSPQDYSKNLIKNTKVQEPVTETKRRMVMYCRNCGKKINDKAEICVNCGVRPLAEKNFCQECGVETKPNQELCIKCGVRLMASADGGRPIKTDFSGLPECYQEEFKKIYESKGSYSGKWNWAAFWFGPIWALTKGLWLSPIICFVAAIFTYGIGGIIYGFIFGARGNYMYYSLYTKNEQLPV